MSSKKGLRHARTKSATPEMSTIEGRAPAGAMPALAGCSRDHDDVSTQMQRIDGQQPEARWVRMRG